MIASKAAVLQRIESELQRFRVPGLRDWAVGLLVPPRIEQRVWMHAEGSPRVDVWIVAEGRDPAYWVGYCDTRPLGPWRRLSRDEPTFGLDDCWFEYLEDAFVAIGWPGPLPDDYEIR
jgi:hypothetical protein